MSSVDKLSSEEIQEAHEIIRWAEALANKYEIGLMIIINTFITSRDLLGETCSAMQFVERELEQVYRGNLNYKYL